MGGVIYDAGALIAADRGNPHMLRLHSQIKVRQGKPIVPLVVLAQAWRGGAHPLLSRVLKGCELLPEDLATARAAGFARAAAGSSDVVDAIVLVTAVRRTARVITSDPDDLRAIADALGVKVVLDVV